MSKAVHWAQVKGLELEAVEPPLLLGWDILLYLPGEYPTQAEAIDAAIKIGYNLGLRAARGEVLADLPQQKLPNPLYDSIMKSSTKTNAKDTEE